MILHPNVKVNLGLHVLRRRGDGFHDIETVFLPCSAYSDTLEIVPSDRPEIVVKGPCYTGWNPLEDLSFRAWKLLSEELGAPPVRIELTKTSPAGAGLGGGSSDAAFTLKAVNEMFSLGLGADSLEELASRLGSDCCFFVRNTPCFAEGRGEILSPAPSFADGFELRVEIPENEAVSTREAYSEVVPRELLECEGMGLREALACPVERWKDVLVNDFEPSVFRLHPAIGRLKESFYARGAVYASMSGSGAAVFGLWRR